MLHEVEPDLWDDNPWEEEQEDINDIEVEAEQVIPEEDWKVVDEEAKPKKILQKGPSEHRVLFTDGSTRKVSKDDNIIRYL